MELMLFRRGLSAIVRNSEVYVISRVVISRFDLYSEEVVNLIPACFRLYRFVRDLRL